MNWTQITVVSLAIANPLNVGLVVNATNGSVQAQLEQVQVKAGEDDGKLRQIPGNPEDLAWNSMPEFEYKHNEHLDTDFEYSPYGYYLPKNIVLINFDANVTIGRVNEILASLDAEIVGADPGLLEVNSGLDLVIRVSTNGFEELMILTAEIHEMPGVDIAIEYTFDGPFNSLLN